MKTDNFFAELKRRNVYKVAVAYAIVGWLLVQVATQVFPFLEIPNWVVRLVIALVAIGFPIALVIAWAFELTPEGIKLESEIEPNKSIKRRTGRKIVAVTIALAVVAGPPCLCAVGLKWAPAEEASAAEQSPFSWI